MSSVSVRVRVRHDLDLDFSLAVGEIKVKMELLFKWDFAKSAEIRVQNEALANGFPPFPGKCKTYQGMQNLPHLTPFCIFMGASFRGANK